MLTVIEISYLKHLYEVENMPLTAIAKKMDLNFRTVKKYANMYDFNVNKPIMKNSSYPVLGEYIETIDKWLTDDLKLPRKQRHTATRIYRRLIQEHKYTGCPRCVMEYVRKKKAELTRQAIGYIPLEHTLGEAQMDWGQMMYYDSDGAERTGYYLIISFPYSNAAYGQIFRGSNSECLMDGMKRIFQRIGGIPSIILTDNMNTIVSKIESNGTRKLTESILRFCLHYRFEFRFCNVCSGNEKGNTENKVGYTRRNMFVPIPVIDDLEQYNLELFNRFEDDMNRMHYKKEKQIKALWEEEKSEMLPLPEIEFEAFTVNAVRINSYGCVVLNTNSYSVSPELSGEKAMLKIYADKIEVYCDHRLICTHSRCYDKHKDIFDWKHYIGLLSHKTSALEHSRFYSQIPKLWQEHVKAVDKRERRSSLQLLKEAVMSEQVEKSIEAIRQSYEHGMTDTESIRQFYYNLVLDNTTPSPCELKGVPLVNYHPDLTGYDELMGGSEK